MRWVIRIILFPVTIILSILIAFLEFISSIGILFLGLLSKGSKTKLKNMVKKGQLEDIEVKDTELKELKKLLNKYGVKFSVMRDRKTGIHSVFFQAKDTQVMNKAFQQVLKTIDKKEERKESIHKQLSHFKSIIKEALFKDKIKNKQKEQSL